MRQQKTPTSPILMKLAVAASGVLAIAAGGLFYYVSVNKPQNHDEKLIKIEVGAKACDPMNLTLPSGNHSFEIHNLSDRPVEWEILDGVMVVEERENIIPGMKAILRAQLMPGDYQITCGLLSNPRGSLTVTPSEHSANANAAKPETRAFIGMLSEYKVFLIMQANSMLKAADTLQKAISQGDLEAARLAYIQARGAYNRTEMIASRFADLSAKIDPAAAYLENREQDEAFTGFPRIEYGLWDQNSTAGLDNLATQLIDDLNALKDRLKSVKLTPDLVLRHASSFLQQQAEGAILNGTDSYAGLDAAEFAAQTESIEKIFKLFEPLSINPAAAQTAAFKAVLDEYRTEIAAISAGNPSVDYKNIDPDTRRKLADKASKLAETIDHLSAALGLNE